MNHSMDITKKVCLCTFSSILIVVLFILSPLSGFFKTSFFMKCVATILLTYTIYLSILQGNVLKTITERLHDNPQINSQLNLNIICSYTFTLFLSLLLIFIVKNMIQL